MRRTKNSTKRSGRSGKRSKSQRLARSAKPKPTGDHVDADAAETVTLPRWAANKVEAAILLNLPDRYKLTRWRREFADAPPVRANGQEPVQEWQEFIERRNLRETLRGPYRDSSETKLNAEARQAEAKATLLEHKVEVSRQTVIARELVKRTFALCLLELKNKLLQMGDAVALKLKFLHDEQKIADILNDFVRSAFRESAKSPLTSFTCPHCKKTVTA